MLGTGRLAGVLILMAMLAGCATSYGPAGLLSGGYTDQAIGGDQYHIEVRGNPFTSVGVAEQHFFRRAQEIVKEHGYDGYRVLALKSASERHGDFTQGVARGVIQAYRNGDKAAEGAGPASGGPASSPRFTASGTGFFLGTGGFVLTNQHVIAECQDITVRQSDGTVVPVTVLAADQVNDLAILKSAAKPSAYARFRAAPDVRRGESVVAFGFPLSSLLSTGGVVTNGTVSALTGFKDDSRLLQISVPIQPGNSGGPLLDQSGNVVGITSSGLSKMPGGGIPQNVNFAIKASVARSFLDGHSVNYEQAPSTKTLSTSEIAEKAEKLAVHIVCTGA
jgi:S1-C subfamily serine protease